MKLRATLATLAVGFAFLGAPSQAHAGGLHHLCPLHWLHHGHHHHAHKPVVKKKVVYKKKHAHKPAKISKPMK